MTNKKYFFLVKFPQMMERLEDALLAMEHNIAVRLDRMEHCLDSYENMVSCKPFMWAITELHKMPTLVTLFGLVVAKTRESVMKNRISFGRPNISSNKGRLKKLNSD